MRLTLLGTGNPAPSPKRAESSYLLRAGADAILLDHGPGANARLMQAGVAATAVSHVVFSHLHYDHTVDFIRLFLNRWDQGAGRLAPLRVFGPPGTRRFVAALFGREGVFAPDIEARCRHPMSVEIYKARGGVPPRAWPEWEAIEIETGEGNAIAGDGWRLWAAEVPHGQPYLVCYGYRLEGEGGVLAYSGDCGPSAAMRGLAEGADLLVHMCANVSGAEPAPESAAAAMSHRALAELARDARVKVLVATHIGPEMDREGVRERLIAEMLAIYPGRLIWAEDLMEMDVGGG